MIHYAPILVIKALMSSTFQAVVRSPSFTGLGYLPDLTPFRNEVRPMGINAGIFLSLLPVICQILKKPISGNVSSARVVVMVVRPECLLSQAVL